MAQNSNAHAQNPALESAIQQGFASGDHQKVLLSLRELASLNPADAEIFHRLAVVEEQVGEANRATQAHFKCLELAPNNPIAYLYTAFWLAQQGREQDALAVYSLGSDLDPAMLQPSERSDGTGLRINAANRALRKHFSNMHRQVTGTEVGLARIHGAVWTRTHDQPYRFRRQQQIPQLLYLPGLTPDHYADTGQLAWVKQLQSQADTIRDEFLASIARARELGRPYLDESMQLGEEFKPLLGSLNWTALDLYRDGVCQHKAAKHFPKTLAALNDAPLYGLTDQPFEVFFSLLKPGHHIKPHYGLSNHSLTVHLPIVTPPSCTLVVNGERRHWHRGELIAFDDSFLHEAINDSGEERVVLIFSIWQPELTSAEREAICRSFRLRSQWLEQRAIPAS